MNLCACGKVAEDPNPRPCPYEQEINDHVKLRVMCGDCYQLACDEI